MSCQDRDVRPQILDPYFPSGVSSLRLDLQILVREFPCSGQFSCHPIYMVGAATLGIEKKSKF